MENIFYIAKLIVRKRLNDLNNEETTALEVWLSAYPDNYALLDSILDDEKLTQQLQEYQATDTTLLRSKIAGLLAENNYQRASVAKHGKKIHALHKHWQRCAAAIILVIAGLLYFFTLRPTPPKTPTPQKTFVAGHHHPDSIDLRFSKATLTLSTGKEISLNQATPATIKFSK